MSREPGAPGGVVPAGLVAIGRIETPYARVEDCPRNVDPEGPPCRIVVDPAYAAGLQGVTVGETILVLYWLGQADRELLVGTSRRSGRRTGAFARRTPHRPNPIGAAAVRVEAVDGAVLHVRGMDCVSGTALLDIKPAIKPEFT